MTREETIVNLEEMKRKVIREMPHVNCFFNPDLPEEKCSCYKIHLITLLDMSIMDVKTIVE